VINCKIRNDIYDQEYYSQRKNINIRLYLLFCSKEIKVYIISNLR